MLSPSFCSRDLFLACTGFRRYDPAAARASEERPVQNPANTKKKKGA